MCQIPMHHFNQREDHIISIVTTIDRFYSNSISRELVMDKKKILVVALIIVLNLVNHIFADLILHYPFNEGSGTIAFDRSGNGRNGIIEYNPQWVDGKIGSCIQLTGFGDRVVDEDGEYYLNGQEALTICLWIKADSIPTDKGFIQGEDPDGNDNVCTIRYDASGIFFGGTSVLKMAVTSNPGGEQFLESSSNTQTTEWQHVCMTWESGGLIRLYLDGVEDEPTGRGGEFNDGVISGCTKFIVGQGAKDTSGGWEGLIDDVRIYNEELSAEQIQNIMEGELFPYAYGPDPIDGAFVEDTWVNLSWKSGDCSISHNIYLGENFDDVNNATSDSDIFRGNQISALCAAGFPGFAYPDGLVPGTTYYWRIDEVNEANPNSPWKGEVWGFSIPPKTAYNPDPVDGAKFIDPNLNILSWTPGFNAKLHTVYFGTDFDTVSNAVGGIPQALTTYTILGGPLEREKTYYWRVDEFNGVETHKGDVWSFVTARVGGGLRAEYYHWTGTFPPQKPFQNFVVSEIVPEINWNWPDDTIPGVSSPNELVNVNNFACKFTGEIEAAFSETYTFYVTTNDGQRLWIDGRLIIDQWQQQEMTERHASIDLIAGRNYPIELWMYKQSGSASCELRWSSFSTPKQIVPQAALSLPVKAMSPNPVDGAVDTILNPILTWSTGHYANSHDVYLGTDPVTVANATKDSPEFKATKTRDKSYNPGRLAWFTTFYWRVDEVNDFHPDSPWVGDVWSFTTRDFILVDDFESYTDDDMAGEAIWQAWIDGFSDPDNGSRAGHSVPPYMEQSIFHSGFQSMPLIYDNTTGVTNSECKLIFISTRDWTEENVAILSLWFHGDPVNAAEPLYITISNMTGDPAISVHNNPMAARVDDWIEWRIPLQIFSDQGIDLTDVDNMTIGLGSKSGTVTSGGSGIIYFDDIRLYRP